MDEVDIYDTTKLTFEGNFNRQVEEIMQHVRLTRQEVEKLQLLFDDLYNALSEVWQGCKVNSFGSIVTGLGIKTSDVDCYVQLPSWLNPPEKSFVMKAKNILKRRHWIFQQLFAITSAKIPIVKFYHAPTRRCCDVNFSGPAGVLNTQLITYLLKIDQRALYLAILIKYWSKIHNLTGFNLMPNYCLTLLVIFYLQQKNILPSVMHLQRNDEYIVDNWNTAFHSVNHVNDDNETLYQLLGGFFKYYNNFKFPKHIISPFTGKTLERDHFIKIETVPKEFSLYKLNINNDKCKPIRLDTFMCVQDPFEHNRNSAVGVHPKLALRIVSHFSIAADTFETTNEGSYLKKLLFNENKPAVISKPNNIQVTNHGINKQYKQKQNLKRQTKFIKNQLKQQNRKNEITRINQNKLK